MTCETCETGMIGPLPIKNILTLGITAVVLVACVGLNTPQSQYLLGAAYAAVRGLATDHSKAVGLFLSAASI